MLLLYQVMFKPTKKALKTFIIGIVTLLELFVKD
jgi:hypothetical protein